MLGSANISGSKALHIMTGNLSHQVEHHLFPDLPSSRYAEIAVEVRDVFERYGLTYVTGPMPKQVASAWWKIIRLSLPNDFARSALDGPVVAPVVALVRRTPKRDAAASDPETAAA
jgi:NADPH-dependent stearoyl-CoA 9-desaturase